jgi:hypothetical protein
MRTFWVVDLPAPLGPRNQKISPRPTVKSIAHRRPRCLGVAEGEAADANHVG